MKKFIKNLKGKKVLSFVLAAIMLATTFNIALPELKLEASAADDITLSDDDLSITQTRVVLGDATYDNYTDLYNSYAERFFGGDGKSEATNFVIPGLSSSDDYTPQGMTYWKAKDWILISAYDASGAGKNSVIYALDGKSTEFVALFKVVNADGSVNTSHGGGIAASEYNFYYADTDSKISYVPLSEMDVPVNTVKEIKLQGSIDCSGEMNNAKTSYCCYDEGVLWTGNFFYSSTNYDYHQPANASYNSMLFGYKLIGNSSQEEWAYLSGKYKNLLNVDTSSGTANAYFDTDGSGKIDASEKNDNNINATCTWNAYKSGDFVDIMGSTTAPTAYVGEFAPSFGSFELVEGKNYIIQYTTNINPSICDFYMFAPNSGGHCNVKQSSKTVKTKLADGRWHVALEFTAGLKPAGADSKWPTTQSTDGTYTGKYTIRFDQDAIQVGESRDFAFTDVSITEANDSGFTPVNGFAYDTEYTVDTGLKYSFSKNTDGTLAIDLNIAELNASNDYYYTGQFAGFNLEEGETYSFTYTSDRANTNVYLFAPNGNHQVFYGSSAKAADGKYYTDITFTAGIKHIGGDSSWPTTQSTDGTYTGTYKLRVDAGYATETTIVSIDDFKIVKADNSRLGYRGNHAGVVGNPTYCIAFDNTIDKIQYSMVNNGRIYISRSWDRNSGSTHIKQLAIGEIDLNSRGTEELTINGRTRYCQLVSLTANNFTTFGGDDTYTDMFYMGEALCVMEGYLYMFAESAAYTYRAKTSDNVCPEPIDVIWKIDQYAIMGEQRETDNEKLSHYELVTDRDKQITNTDNSLLNTDEYIIVYESSVKDPITQKNILYALDAFGGNTGSKLPKNSNGDFASNENANGYTVGIVGHPITEYDIQDGNLYLTNPEKDDLENIRWKFSNASTDEPFRFYELQSVSPYYSKYKELFFSGKKVFMAPEADDVRLGVQPATDNKWYITIGKERFMWCNDGTRGFEDEINAFYKTDLNTSVFVEQAGTFHTDATTDDNVVRRNIGEENYDLGQFYIYKRVLDPNAEKENSKVYTNSTATLQPDGTYTVDMETYAIAPTHYTLLEEQRPTDFIFVLDASGSMTNNTDAVGYHTSRNWSAMTMGQACGDVDKSFFANGDNYSAAHTSNLYYKLPDGTFARIQVAFNNGDGTYGRYIWLWCVHPDTGRCYKISKNGYLVANSGSERITDEYFLENSSTLGYANATEIVNEVSNKTNYTDSHNSSDYNSTAKRRDYEVLNHTYTVDGVTRTTYYNPYGTCSRLCGMQQAVEQLSFKIADKAASTGLAHRVALVTYGSDGNESWLNTGMYVDGVWNQFSGSSSISASTYQSAFYDVSEFAAFRRGLYAINTESDDPDTYSSYGYEMASNIVDNYSGGYLADGDRSACIIMVTDGIPGQGKDDTNKDTVANSAITQAYNAKQKGAYNFTVQMGDASGDWSSMTTYIEALSSEYVDAKSLTDLGDRNANEVNYAMSIPMSSFNLDSLANDMFAEITANSRMALTQLDTDSILRQTLSDKFYAPVDGANVKYYYADGSYDGLGRIAFDEEVEVTEDSGIKGSAITSADGTCYESLEVRGFDYKENYISKEHGGKKLIVRVTGLLPKTSVVGTNASINNDNKTGIYQTDAMLSADQAFKGFPGESFTIPEYTYVLDYGLQMLDTDVNGTLCAVSDTLSKQTPDAYNKSALGGDLAIQTGDQNLLYSLTPDKTDESGYTLIKRDDGTYDWFKINVVPASNVYYEETKMTDGATGKVAWSTAGEQDAANRVLPSVDDPYGWDNAYDNTSDYSNGTALSATVNSTNRNTSKKTFKFTGTGIDIVSACGRTTGIIAVNIKDTDGNRVKGYIVDTYYAEGSFNGADLVSQVPVVSWSGAYGTYTVEIAGMYLSSAGAVKETIKSSIKNKLIDTGLVMNSGKPVDNKDVAKMLKSADLEDFIAEDMELIWFDDNSVLNGGTGVEPTKNGSRGADPGTAVLDNYIDGFRVYNPLGTDSSLYPETEKNVSYANVINHLATLEGDATELDGIAYIAGSLADGEKLSFANYQSVGPKNELYLNGNNSVSFKINVAANEKIMLGLRAVKGAVANANISSVVVEDSTKSASYTIKEINSRTEMYYDITECLHSDVRTNGGEVTITVSNTDADMLAINHIKFSGAEESFTGGMSPRSVSRSGDTATEVVANRFLPMTQNDLDEIQAVLASEPIPAVVKNGVVTPLVEEEEELPGDNNQGEVPGGDNNEGELPGGDGNEGDVSQDPDNGDTGSGDNSDSTESIFDIFSLLKGLINLIKKILFATVGNESLF